MMTEKRSIEEIMKAYSEVPDEDFRQKLKILNELSQTMFKEGKPLLASETVKAELSRIEAPACIELANITHNMIKYSCVVGNYDSSIEYALKAVVLFKEFGTADDVNDVIGNIGGVYVYMERFEESLEYTDKALEYAQTIGDDLAVANFLNNKAVALKSLERFEEAMDCLIKAIEIKLSLGKKADLCNSYFSLSEVLISAERYDEVPAIFNKTEPLVKEIEDPAGSVEFDFLKAQYYMGTGSYAKALEKIESYIEYQKESGSMSKVPGALRNKIRIHEELGEEGLALETYRELDLLSQRTYKETCSAMAAELAASFRFQQKMHEIQLLSNQNLELQEAKTTIEKQYEELLEIDSKLKKANELLEKQAEIDPLTGLLNQKKMYPIIEREINRATRYGTPLSMIMIDLDNFKNVNDTYGHLQGDILLKNVAGIIRSSLRKVDFVFRYGGEEFLVLLPSSDLQMASSTADRLRDELAKTTYPKVTMSAGVSSWSGEDATHFIQKTDHLLYAAKGKGKNRVEFQKGS
ncbi:diguanylate cyclase [Mesotoga sp.]|uniref:tetratricopeptide repeat-containing diguanylate cyclase n=1 Tax=Mesotoga sp. TaxID=2053577 RepID=UPI00345ED47D